MVEVRALLETVVDMTSASAERADLEPPVLMLVRLGALAAVDASSASYLLNLGSTPHPGLTLEEARSVLIAIAPIVGTPKVMAAAATIGEALGMPLSLDDALRSDGLFALAAHPTHPSAGNEGDPYGN